MSAILVGEDGNTLVLLQSVHVPAWMVKLFAEFQIELITLFFQAPNFFHRDRSQGRPAGCIMFLRACLSRNRVPSFLRGHEEHE